MGDDVKLLFESRKEAALRTTKRVLAETANKVLQMELDFFVGLGYGHGHDFASNNGSLASAADQA